MTTVTTTPRHRGLHVPSGAWTAILLLLAVGAASVLVVNWPVGVDEGQPGVGVEAYYWEEVGRQAIEVGSVGTAAVAEPYYLQVLDEAALEGRVALADQLAETYWADVNEQALVLSAEPYYLQVLGEAALEGRVALAEHLAETYWADINTRALVLGAEPYYLQVLDEAAMEGRVALAEQLAETYWADINEEALERGKGTPDPDGVRQDIVEKIEVSGG